MKKFKIVVTYVEAGMGHIVSARAVSDALKRLYSDEVEVEDCYLLRDSKSKLLVRHERYLVGKVKSFYKHKHYLNFFFFLDGSDVLHLCVFVFLYSYYTKFFAFCQEVFSYFFLTLFSLPSLTVIVLYQNFLQIAISQKCTKLWEKFCAN